MALYVLGIVALAVGVAGVVLPALPGAPLLVVGVALVAWAGDFARVGWPTIAVAAVLAVFIMAVDWIAGVLGAKVFGASKWAVLGAGVGVLAGIFFGLPGIILGPAVGAVAFEYWKNPEFGRAAKAGLGVFVGFLAGSVVKVALAFTIIGVLVIALVV
jgi:uncharacterized protein YqgC (DUF456 family)